MALHTLLSVKDLIGNKLMDFYELSLVGNYQHLIVMILLAHVLILSYLRFPIYMYMYLVCFDSVKTHTRFFSNKSGFFIKDM